MFKNFREKAKEMIRRTGDRATNNRIFILSILLSEQEALTHREIEQRVSMNQQFDRVTLYRVLEWLNKKDLVHKITSDDRVWRFRVNTIAHSPHHAHFMCTRCTRITCLSELEIDFIPTLPVGYFYQDAEVTIKGLCAECV